MEPAYEVFISYAHKDANLISGLVRALRAAGLRVFIDETEVEAFSSIQGRVDQGIARSKLLLAWYSTNYSTSRACQWELSAAYLGGSGERVLVINPEASTEHIQPRSLLDRLFAVASDPNQLAYEVKRRADEFQDALGAKFRLNQPRPFGFQPAGSNRFVGRVAELWAIDDALKRSANPMLSGVVRSIVQIRGLAGIGKSLLAEEYSLRFGPAFPGGIFWLKAMGSDTTKSVPDREADRKQQITEFAAQLALPIQGKQFPEIWSMLAGELPKRECLWIVDDAPSGLTREQISVWYSPYPAVPTLITIPDLSHGDLGVKVDLDALTQAEALDLLRTHKLKEEDPAGPASLVEALDRHPLAIDIAGSYLEFRNGAISCADFVKQLRTSTRDQLEFAAKIQHAPGIANALSATIAQLKAPAIDVLVLASVVASAPIPAEFIDAVLARLYQSSLEDAQQTRMEATAETDRFALSRFDPVRPEARRVHTLVSRTARLHAAAPERIAQIRQAAVAVLTDTLEAMTYAKIFRLGLESMHARELSASPGNGEEAALLVLVGAFDLVRGDLVDAERLGHRALDYCTAALGSDHPYADRAKALLGVVLMYKADYAGARVIFEPVVSRAERRLPPGDHYRLGGQLALASICTSQGEFEKAVRIAETAVSESVSANGVEHPLTLNAETMLSQGVAAQGDNVRAIKLMSEVLAARRRQAAEGDPDLLFEELLMIAAWGFGSDLRDAQPIIDKAVDVFTDQFGNENTLTLLARIYRTAINLQTGHIQEMRHESTGLLATLDRVFGPEHLLTLQVKFLQSQALVLEERYAEAEAQLEPLITSLGRALNPHHSEVIMIKLSLADTLLRAGDQQRAYIMLQEVQGDSDAHLGRDHPTSIASRCALASCLLEMGRLTEATSAWDELIAIPAARTNSLTFTCANRIGFGLIDAKDPLTAQSVMLRALPIAEAQFGECHPTVVGLKTALAINAAGQCQLTEAAHWWTQVLSANDRTLGHDDPTTISTAWSLFLVRSRMAEYAVSYQIFQKYFLGFCTKDVSTLDSTQREILQFLQENTPWLPTHPA